MLFKCFNIITFASQVRGPILDKVDPFLNLTLLNPIVCNEPKDLVYNMIALNCIDFCVVKGFAIRTVVFDIECGDFVYLNDGARLCLGRICELFGMISVEIIDRLRYMWWLVIEKLIGVLKLFSKCFKINKKYIHLKKNTPKKMLRCEKMNLIKLYLSKDNARKCIEELGETEMIHFKDLNNEIKNDKLLYINEIKHMKNYKTDYKH
ncbi:uncoordinated family member (unc-32) [Vairimorpha apis BRL 01]|uniref:Uncoordinated family member (Unc-32) n=1 Tax=Vairimorpha apis BRL 01 TaxID=1037528 RepID=T0L4S7_9MICR|nr:uncoordinated family member (unc-32) [Vairimorpha apis BRL 01]